MNAWHHQQCVCFIVNEQYVLFFSNVGLLLFPRGIYSSIKYNPLILLLIIVIKRTEDTKNIKSKLKFL